MKQAAKISAEKLISLAWITLLLGGSRLVYSLATAWRLWHHSHAGLSRYQEVGGGGARSEPRTGARGCKWSTADVVFRAEVGAGLLLVCLGLYLWRNWSTFWDKACDKAFDSIDIDGSGKVDAAELEMGVIIVYANAP